jgi:diguanylate cyclase (GGDEF)-like protein/PAS domain S-box-containing protein
MAITGLDGSYLQVNQALCNTFGYSVEEMLGMNFSDISYPNDNAANIESLKKVIKGEFDSFKMEKRFYSKEGQIVYTLLQVTLIRNTAREPQHYIGQVVDITERKNIEEALQRLFKEQNLQVKELQQRNLEINLLNEMGDLLQSCQSREDAYAVVAQFMDSLFSKSPGGLYILSDSRLILDLVTSWGENQAQNPVYDARKCWALRRGQLHTVTQHQSKLCCHVETPSEASLEYRPYICIPLVAQGETFGVLHVTSPQEDPGSPYQTLEHWEQLVRSVAERSALALANLKLREILHVQSIRDVLTNLFNRRYMEETLERELHRAQRRGTNLGFIMMDIDHFKAFNDTYGHDAGDTLLHELGNYLQLNIRAEDIACRYGGEEFVIILPEINQEDVLERAEELRLGIRDLRVQYHGQFLRPVTMSFGVAMYPQHGPGPTDLIRAADNALYQAKHNGRDRVEAA